MAPTAVAAEDIDLYVYDEVDKDSFIATVLAMAEAGGTADKPAAQFGKCHEERKNSDAVN